MRRTLLIVTVAAVVSSVVTAFTVTVAWSATQPVSRAGEGAAADARLPIIFDTRVDCGVPRQGADWPDQDALEDTVRCLEREIINVNKFMRFFFRCTRITQVTQYGEDPRGGTFGYLWDNGDGSPVLLTTALNYTIDPTRDPFNYFLLWQDAEQCVF